jgi:hypothetical protein
MGKPLKLVQMRVTFSALSPVHMRVSFSAPSPVQMGPFPLSRLYICGEHCEIALQVSVAFCCAANVRRHHDAGDVLSGNFPLRLEPDTAGKTRAKDTYDAGSRRIFGNRRRFSRWLPKARAQRWRFRPWLPKMTSPPPWIVAVLVQGDHTHTVSRSRVTQKRIDH